MPYDIILNLPGFEIIEVEVTDHLVIHARYYGDNACPHCGGQWLRTKDSFTRTVRHESFGNRISSLSFKAHKFKCMTCGKYFNQRFPGILKHKRSSESFRREVFLKHNHGICQSTLSALLKIGQATVERCYKDFIKRKVSEFSGRSCPIVIGIDEHFFSKKHGFATTICDLRNHKVYDVTLGRSEKSLEPYFNKLTGKENVKVVVMDLAETYRASITKHFPNAKIVADRFHVIKLINHHFLKLWQEIDPEGRKNRGLLSLMRRHEHKLSDKQKLMLNDYLVKTNGMLPIYQFKQRLALLMLLKTRTKKMCEKLIPVFLELISMLKSSAFAPFVTLGCTLDSWKEEVVRMWRFSKTNGITEGFHTKMEMISRRAFGFRNFENYRLRVKALCA